MRLPFLALAALALAGCASYHLGTGARTPFRTLYVAPVANKSFAPQADAIVSNALRRQFLTDDRVTLTETAGEADATLTVVITDYRREVATVRPGDTGLARSFAITLGTNLTLHDNRGSRDFFHDRRVEVTDDAYTDSGQLQAEYQNLPRLAELLARKVSGTVLDVW